MQAEKFKSVLFPAFLWSIPILAIYWLLTLFDGFVIKALFTKGVLFYVLLASTITKIAGYVIFLYLGLKYISKKFGIKNYADKLTLSISIAFFVLLISTIIASIAEQRFIFYAGSLMPIPLILTFIVPMFYNAK